MIKIKRIEHIGVAVNDCSGAAAFYRMLGMNVAHTEELNDAQLKVAMLPVGEAKLELMQPTTADNTVAKFLARRGEGLHHIALCVEDIGAAVNELLAAGVRMIDKAPRPGAGGKKVAFVHPEVSSGVLIELVEE